MNTIHLLLISRELSSDIAFKTAFDGMIKDLIMS